MEQPGVVSARALLHGRSPRTIESTPHDMALAPGTQLGPYDIESLLGSGGMGEVYKARDRRLNRTVAIKWMIAKDKGRFQSEARAIAAINHPHICQIYDIGPDYLVLEYLEGEQLRGPVAPREAVRLGRQIADALQAAHERGILHRDLKPANVMVVQQAGAPQVKLLDFGVARLAPRDDDATRTLAGDVIGTPAYMSPEQAAGKPLDARSDEFSFGAVLYELLTGTRAFAGDSTAQILSAVLRDDPQPLPMPVALREVVKRCLAKDPERRFQTMAEVRSALEQLEFAEPPELEGGSQSRQIAPPVNPSSVTSATAEPRLERVTSAAAATFWTALSPDARMVAYVSDAGQDGAPPQVWVQQVGGAAVQLTRDLRECAEPSFTPDGTRVIFSAVVDSTRHVYQIPTLGGTPQILTRAARNARYSPDGRWLLYVPFDSENTVRVVSADGMDRELVTGLVDITSASWSDNSRALLVVGHRDRSTDQDCWIVGLEGEAPIHTGAFRQARQQGLIVIAISPTWSDDSIFFSAAGRQGLRVWRQRLSPITLEAQGAPELLTPGGESAFFPTVAHGRLAWVGVHADTNMWSVEVDPSTGRARGMPRRLTRGSGFVSYFSVSRDGKVLAYFAAGQRGPELRLRDFERGTDSAIDTWGAASPGFPAISLDGTRVAFGTLVPGPPVRRPVWVVDLAGGEPRMLDEDAGGRPRVWLDDSRVLIETFGSGLNSFIALDVADATTRPLLASPTRRLTNPRLSPDGRWLAFDAAPPGGSPSVFVTRMDQGPADGESGWIGVAPRASHAFWSRDGRLLYYLPTTPTVDIRNKVAARAFDLQNGRVGLEELDVMTLSETIVPALITAAAPIVAGEQIIFLLGNYRGDIWIRDIGYG
jgi:eukaryotic-like serine/threonine-protein kinase